jgi:hypothetical protein
MAEAQAELNVDDDRIRVNTWTFTGPGAAIGRHTHEFDYIVVPVTGGAFKVTDADGTVHTMEQVAGKPYQGTKGTHHDVESASNGEVRFVEIELKH